MWLDQVDTLQYFTFLVLHFKQPTETFSFYNNTIVKYTKNTTHFLVILALDIFSSSGQQYTVSVYQVVSISSGDTREVTSEPVSAVFTTKPLAPRDVSTEQLVPTVQSHREGNSIHVLLFFSRTQYRA